MTTAVSTEQVTPPAEPRSRFTMSGLRELCSKLFPEDETKPRKRANVWWAIVAVAVGTVVSLARTTGAGPFQTIWEEDARDLLTDALMNPTAYNLVKPYVGYFQIGPRILAEVATLFPISWAAAVMSIEAALICSLLALAVYVASGTHLKHPLARFLVSAPLLFSATAENIYSEIYNRPATIQFFLVYAVFWLVLWVPKSRAGRITQIAVIGLSAISTFLVVVLIPLAIVRLWVRRDRISLAIAGFLCSGFVLQMAGLALGLTDRSFASPRYNPVWALEAFFFWAVPHSILGWNHAQTIPGEISAIQAGHLVGIGMAWAVVIAVIVLAARKVTQPAWLLAIVAAGHSVALACMTIMANGMITQRYLLPVQMLLFTALVALLLPAAGRARMAAQAPLVLLACLVLVVGAINYRHTDTWRNKGPLWTEQVKLAAGSCGSPERREVAVRSGPAPYWSIVVVPCHVFRVSRWCQPPFCMPIGAGQPDLVDSRLETD